MHVKHITPPEIFKMNHRLMLVLLPVVSLESPLKTLGMLVLILVSMFRGDSKLTTGTKISIIRWFILKISGGVVTTPLR